MFNNSTKSLATLSMIENHWSCVRPIGFMGQLQWLVTAVNCFDHSLLLLPGRSGGTSEAFLIWRLWAMMTLGTVAMPSPRWSGPTSTAWMGSTPVRLRWRLWPVEMLLRWPGVRRVLWMRPLSGVAYVTSVMRAVSPGMVQTMVTATAASMVAAAGTFMVTATAALMMTMAVMVPRTRGRITWDGMIRSNAGIPIGCIEIMRWPAYTQAGWSWSLLLWLTGI